MKELTLYPVIKEDELARPEVIVELSLATSAMQFFTDYRVREALVIDDDTKAIDAHKAMLAMHEHLRLVVDKAEHFAGVISSQELTEQNIIRNAVEAKVPRGDLEVKDLMTPKKDLFALDIREVEKAKISEVVEMLKDNHQKYCLVVDETTHHIVGVVSAYELSLKLNVDLDIADIPSFYHLYAEVS